MSEPNTTVDELTVDSRYNGPPTSANGGYVSGLLARRAGSGPVQVTLRLPPPLDTAMAVRETAQGGVRLEADGELVAEAQAAPEPGDVIEPVPVEVARRGEERFRGWSGHPFPSCFVCGPERENGDGLRLFAGPVQPEEPTSVACVWTPEPAATHLSEQRSELVWAALDCPGAWSSQLDGRPMVLGRMTAVVYGLPQAARQHVVVGRRLGEERRKTFTGTAVYGPRGELLAAANATWITLRS